jgi:DNA-directed RNA polymerase delta subunit
METTFTIADLEKMVAEHEASAVRVKAIINELCAKSNLPPRYPASELQQSSGSVFNIRGDQFHGRPLATCVREYLEMRRRSDLGPATTNEIFDALAQGGYEFGAKNEQIARVSTYNSINKNPVFYKLPSKKWGLREWYPNAKQQDHEEEEVDESTDTVKPDAAKSPAKSDSAATQIQKILGSDVNKQWSVDELVTKIPDVKKESVSAILFRLKRENKTEKVGRGLWKLNPKIVSRAADILDEKKNRDFKA